MKLDQGEMKGREEGRCGWTGERWEGERRVDAVRPGEMGGREAGG